MLFLPQQLDFIFKKLINYCYYFFAVLDLHCCASFSVAAVSGGYSPVAVHGLLLVVAFLIAEHFL